MSQIIVELRLFERFAQHTACVCIGDVMGIAAHCTDQHRQARHQRFQEYGAGVFVIGRVNQHVRTQQEARNIAAPFEKLHMLAQPQRRALQLENLGVVLTNHKQTRTLFQLPRQRRQCF